ncbi:MAG: hypothetical protein IJQ24_02320 [Synergistaceae bacterium]|nr:hypothetical protein [Synergistaceae bacterium]MBQ6114902.1 hypothetical protein [Synergistaceae bacterium]MBR0184845.1 hypothetical protein [Synergistaceae bacterium]
MKKICVLLLLLAFGTASYGAISDDVYVRKDVFEAQIHSLNKRIDDLRSSMYMFVGILLLAIIVCSSTAYSHKDNEPTFTLEDVERLIDKKLSGNVRA